MGAIRSAARRHPDVCLFLFILVVLAPFVQQYTAQPAARYSLTAALWEHHSVDISKYPVGIDRATLTDGQVRSDKAPGQPLLAVPVYAVGRAAGVEPGTHEHLDRNLGLWWVTLWSTMIPLALLAVLMRRAARSLHASAPTAATLAIIFGSTIAIVATELFGHILAATFAFAAWYVLRAADPKRAAPWALGGLLVGLAVITEFPTVLLGIVLGVFVLWRARHRVGWFVLGGLPPALVLAIYDQAAFGAPWRVGYDRKKSLDGGFFGINVPRLHVLAQIFFAPKGLVMLTPIVLLAVVLAVMQAREPGPGRVDAIVALACFGMLLIVQSGWPNAWGGEYAGPRYMIPALPFLATPLALGWHRFRAAAVALSTWSIAVMSLSYVTYGLVGQDGSAINLWLQRVRDHAFTPTLWSMAFGNAGALLHLLLIGGAAALVYWSTVPRETGADADALLTAGAPRS
jgi:hypothetical protein